MPHRITSAGPGELFVVRNIGNIVPSTHRALIGGVSAALEYAVGAFVVVEMRDADDNGGGASFASLLKEGSSSTPAMP